MIIRRAQLEAYTDPTNPVWVQTTISELRSNLPGYCQFLRDPDLEELIAQARSDSAATGFTVEQAVPLFAEMRLILGTDWLQDPILNPLLIALDACREEDEEERLQDWYEAIDEYLDATFGEDDVFITQAVSRLGDPLKAAVHEDLELFYQEKWCFAESAAHDEFLKRAAQAMTQYQWAKETGRLYMRLMLLLGCGFDRDPVFRPLSEMLQQDPSGAALSQKAPDWVREWWDSQPPTEEE